MLGDRSNASKAAVSSLAGIFTPNNHHKDSINGQSSQNVEISNTNGEFYVVSETVQ